MNAVRLLLILVMLILSAKCAHLTAAAEPTRLRISIPGLGTTSYPLIMAQKKGYFRAEGFDVELIPMSGGLAVKTLEVAINEAREASGIKRGVKHEEIYDFSLMRRVNDELRGWRP